MCPARHFSEKLRRSQQRLCARRRHRSPLFLFFKLKITAHVLVPLFFALRLKNLPVPILSRNHGAFKVESVPSGLLVLLLVLLLGLPSSTISSSS